MCIGILSSHALRWWYLFSWFGWCLSVLILWSQWAIMFILFYWAIRTLCVLNPYNVLLAIKKQYTFMYFMTFFMLHFLIHPFITMWVNEIIQSRIEWFVTLPLFYVLWKMFITDNKYVDCKVCFGKYVKAEPTSWPHISTPWLLSSSLS